MYTHIYISLYTSYIMYVSIQTCILLKITYIYFTVSLMTALLKYDSHTKFTHLKCTVR